jgi:hypothetical protein
MSVINMPIFLFLLLFVYLFSISFSFYAIFFDELAFRRYHRLVHLRQLLLVPFLEPLIYHPMNVYFAIRGNIAFWRGDKRWGKQERVGFDASERPQA